MMGNGTEDERPTNGRYVTWRAYHEDQATQARARSHEQGGLSERLRKVESVIDQQRGARAAIYALIGTNAAAIIIGVFNLFG